MSIFSCRLIVFAVFIHFLKIGHSVSHLSKQTVLESAFVSCNEFCLREDLSRLIELSGSGDLSGVHTVRSVGRTLLGRDEPALDGILHDAWVIFCGDFSADRKGIQLKLFHCFKVLLRRCEL